jgi:formylglycine-generating enzyme required for sulfatase activity
LVWRKALFYNDPYVEWYLRHPAYSNYPVVGVTHKQCESYCEWLTIKYNEKEKKKFKKVKFRLPTKHEWYASASFIPSDKKSKDGNKNSDNFISTTKEFPWSGPYIRNKEGKIMANFAVIDEGSVHREYDSVMTVYGKKDIRMRYVCDKGYESAIAGSLDAADITAPVNSYWPNEAGMYNLAGNVEEFVSEYGITKGGSWYDTGFYLRNCSIESYDSTDEASETRGFRFVMEVVEE